jgi:hypothetical protein
VELEISFAPKNDLVIGFKKKRPPKRLQLHSRRAKKAGEGSALILKNEFISDEFRVVCGPEVPQFGGLQSSGIHSPWGLLQSAHSGKYIIHFIHPHCYPSDEHV